MLIIFQAIFVFFMIFAIAGVVKKKKDGLLGLRGMMFWTLFWLLAGLLVVWPNSTMVLANYLGIGRGADLVVYTALAAVFYVLFRLHIKLEQVNRSLTKLVRQQALSEEDGKKQVK